MSLKSQKPQSMEETTAVVSDRHADIDFFIYATLGPLCFIVVLGFLLLTLYKYVRKHPVLWPWKRKFRQPSFWPGGDLQHRHHRMTDECVGGRGHCGNDCASPSVDEMAGTVNVIYSGEFEQSQQQQLSGSWLDDASFVPDDSLDRIRTPTLLRTVPPPAVKNKTFTDMLQQQQQHCDDQVIGGSGGVGVGADDLLQPHHRQRHHHHHRQQQQQHLQASRDGQCAAVAAAVAAATVHTQSPRLSRENKLRILGCKQSCLLLPAVQPVVVDDGRASTATVAMASATRPDRPSATQDDEDDCGGQP